ncbi:OMS28 family porin [Borreliella burgdorferi]|nr:OMS28 family porin [Borreliella burgdorferi]MDO7272962.1 OMS28 family porin [Borreliella burgdorferi]MDO7279548.1 OMS28 family porin [Borreliella burgdorferi]
MFADFNNVNIIQFQSNILGQSDKKDG